MRDARELRGWSQTDLAEKLSRPQSWLSDVENGDRGVELPELRALASTLGLAFNDLISPDFDDDEAKYADGAVARRKRGNPNWETSE